MATFIPNVTDVFPEPSLFTPDFSFMDTMLQRRQAMYDQGWAQVNNAYGYVKRDLTNPQNVKERDIFLKQAKENLKGLSGMDLSQHQNVMAARSVFEPWTGNKKVLGDAALTAHWKQQESIGEGYRLEDGGKLFNQANVDYIRKQRAAFATDAAENWEEYWGSKRSYTPYYDYNNEVQELMKSFKPSTSKIERVNGLYKYRDEKASWTQAEIRKYLDANLSDKAKQQMKIEADVKYNNSPQQMGQVFMSISKSEMDSYDTRIELANKKLMSATKPEEVKEIKTYINQLEDSKKSLQTTMNAIKSGDYTFIKKRGESIAMDIYYNQFINKVSNGWSHLDVVHEIKADEVALNVYDQNRQDARQIRGFEFEMYKQKKAHEQAIELAKMKGEVLGGGPGQYSTVTFTNDQDQVSLASYQNSADQKGAQAAYLNELNKGMVVKWASELPENRGKILTTKDITNELITKFRNEGFNGKPLPPDHQFRKNEQQAAKFDGQKNQYLGQISNIQDKIEASYSDEKKAQLQKAKQQVASFGSVTLDDGTVISATQLLQTMQINPDNVQSFAAPRVQGYTLKIGNKLYETRSVVGLPDKNPGLNTLINNVKSFKNSSNILKDVDKDIKEYFRVNGKLLTNTNNLRSFDKSSKEVKLLESPLQSIFPDSDFNVESAGIGVDANNQGSAYFFITPKGNKTADSKSIIGSLNQRGYTDVQAQDVETGTIYRINNYRNPVTQLYSQFNEQEQVALTLISQLASAGKAQSGLFTSRSNRRLMIEKDHGSYWLRVEDLTGKGTDKMEVFPQAFNDPTDAIIMGQNLTSEMGGVSEAGIKLYQANLGK